MELNKNDLKTVLDLLNDKLDTINNEVALMGREKFDSMLMEKSKLSILREKVLSGLQPVAIEEEWSMFGV